MNSDHFTKQILNPATSAQYTFFVFPARASGIRPLETSLQKSMPAPKLALVVPKGMNILEPAIYATLSANARAPNMLWGNQQSAARSNGRKMRCMERKVQMLQNEADSLSSQLMLLQRDTSDMRAVNSELKLLLQDMEQKNHLHDVFKEELDEEIQHLKVAAGQHFGTSMTLPPFGSKKQAEAVDRAATPPGPAT
ncbi:hypothetical protein L1987_78646 [Smallanthus sonchifolius]|uniref:Uncharacterized protein n=1 Tax=Smallanthus sonchifolius TaxID=185202 RepID=A0ACB8ZCB7_9ASTR|nr:hypothetical protein L1987_78646 [Smallanthus sonchifolius]